MFFLEYAKKLKLNLVLAVVFVLVFVVESTETEVSNVPPVVTVYAECLVFLLWSSFIFTHDVSHFLCCYTRAATLNDFIIPFYCNILPPEAEYQEYIPLLPELE